jgi:hypothetical protein
MKLILLYGPPAVGKLTIAKEIARLTGFKVFHAHLTVDLVASIFPRGTPAYLKLVWDIRFAVFAEAARRGVAAPHRDTPWKGAIQMAEPTAQRLRVTFTVKPADHGRFIIACDPLESESTPVLPGATPTESEAALAASDPTETEAVIRGSERDPTLIEGVFTFELQDSVTEAQARHLAQQMTDLLSHLRYTPLRRAG